MHSNEDGPAKGRQFQLWEYHVSHGHLLIRSPKRPGVETNVDLVFVGVELIVAARHMNEVAFVEPSLDEMQWLEEQLEKKIESPLRVWVLQGRVTRSFIVALQLNIDEHIEDIFYSPFSKIMDRYPSSSPD